MRRIELLGLVIAILLACGSSFPQDPFADSLKGISGRYLLVEGSTLTDDCSPCARPILVVPVRGEFFVRGPAVDASCGSVYFVDGQFRSLGEPLYEGKMRGTYRTVTGPVAGGQVNVQGALQQMRLDLTLGAGEPSVLDSGVVPAPDAFPWIDVTLLESTLAPSPLGSYRLHLVAVRWPRVLFSTRSGFTPAVGATHVSDGDLLTSTGHVLFTNSDLTQRLGIMPVVPDLGLDAAMAVLVPRAEAASELVVYFSAETDIFSGVLGPLAHGDLISTTGSVVRRNVRLLAPFSPAPPAVADLGLDAVAAGPQGTLLFSVEQEFFSEALERRVGPGDLLEEGGTIFRSQTDLLARFQPVNLESAPGLDAVFVWPSGEIWFSTEQSFQDARYGTVQHGDLLSDTGRVVARNLDLLRPFGPIEDLADFGLDSLVLDAAAGFEDCGVLVQGSDCVLFRADGGGLYAVFETMGFAPGDRVKVAGRLEMPCTAGCREGDGCIAGNTIEPCPFEGCGILVAGPGDCVVFQADSGDRYLLDDRGAFQTGDRVFVVGRVVQGCNSACVTPCVAIVGNTISSCAFEDCGQLVDAGGGCVVLVTGDGKRYVVENLDGFAPGDAVIVAGDLAKDCSRDCALAVANDGCIDGNSIDSLGSIGEVGFFRRADCNSDGKPDVSDAVYGLMYLFSSGEPPLCPDACNSNGDEQLDITDSIFTLNFLFLGGQEPPSPFPGCDKVDLQILCGLKPCPCFYPEASCDATP